MATEDSTYIVNLPIQVKAPSPAEAVAKFHDTVLDHGLRGWAYNVRDEDGNTRIMTGFGKEVEEEDVPATTDEPSAESS